MKTRLKVKDPTKNSQRKIETALRSLYSACLKNASELLEESRLLLSHGYHARAYFLAHTAMEELGKSQVVADFSNDQVAMSEFQAAFQDHSFKVAYMNRHVEIPRNWEDDDWLITYDKNSQRTKSQPEKIPYT